MMAMYKLQYINASYNTLSKKYIKKNLITVPGYKILIVLDYTNTGNFI